MAHPVKSKTQSLLKRLGVYQRVKSSFLYDLYWRWTDPRLIRERDRELEFFRRTLAGFCRNDLIFDIGANLGHKTDIFLRLGARVVAVDPDEQNQKILRQRFLEYRFHRRPVTIVAKAVSDRKGVETMWVDEPGSAKNTLNQKWVETLRTDSTRFGETLQFREKAEVETITLNQMIEEFGRPFYVKIDVEGYEPCVLRGLLTAVPYVSFEVNLPEFRSEGQQCIDRLREIAPFGMFNYAVGLRGLMLREWVSHNGFAETFAEITEASVEVFWRTKALKAASSE